MKEKLTNFQMIRQRLADFTVKDELFVSNSEIAVITEELCLDQMTELELRNLRDTVVLIYHNWKRDERIEHDDGYIEYTQKWDELERTSSAILTVIDSKIFSKRNRGL